MVFGFLFVLVELTVGDDLQDAFDHDSMDQITHPYQSR